MTSLAAVGQLLLLGLLLVSMLCVVVVGTSTAANLLSLCRHTHTHTHRHDMQVHYWYSQLSNSHNTVIVHLTSEWLSFLSQNSCHFKVLSSARYSVRRCVVIKPSLASLTSQYGWPWCLCDWAMFLRTTVTWWSWLTHGTRRGCSPHTYTKVHREP